MQVRDFVLRFISSDPTMPWPWVARFVRLANSLKNHYEQSNAKAKTERMQAIRQRIQHPRHRARLISRIIDPKPTFPLLFAARTKAGPQGQPPGSLASAPREVDDIVQEAWRDIYVGQQRKPTHELIDHYMRRYSPHLYHDAEFQLPSITADRLRAA